MTNTMKFTAVAVDCTASLAAYELALAAPLLTDVEIAALASLSGRSVEVRFAGVALSAARLYRDLERLSGVALVIRPAAVGFDLVAPR